MLFLLKEKLYTGSSIFFEKYSLGLTCGKKIAIAISEIIFVRTMTILHPCPTLTLEEDSPVLPLLDLYGLVVCPVALQAFGGGGLAANEALLALENQHGAVRQVEEEP